MMFCLDQECSVMLDLSLGDAAAMSLFMFERQNLFWGRNKRLMGTPQRSDLIQPLPDISLVLMHHMKLSLRQCAQQADALRSKVHASQIKQYMLNKHGVNNICACRAISHGPCCVTQH
jgi:hypothetical protein